MGSEGAWVVQVGWAQVLVVVLAATAGGVGGSGSAGGVGPGAGSSQLTGVFGVYSP